MNEEDSEAKLVEGTKTIIQGRAEWLMRQNVCKVKLTSKTLAWVAKYLDNGKFNKTREYPLESVRIGFTKGNDAILFKELGRLTIYLNKNSSSERKEWTIQFPPKMNKDLEDFLSEFRLLKNNRVQTEFYERNKKIALGFEKRKNYNAAIKIWEELDEKERAITCIKKQIDIFINEKKFTSAIEAWEKIGNQESLKEIMQIKAKERELALDFTSAIRIWEELGEINEAARVRKLQAEMGSVKVAQKVVQGDEITKTEIKDSVVSKSNIGSSGDDKFTKLKELTEMKEKGFIDDDEFKQMKKEILGK